VEIVLFRTGDITDYYGRRAYENFEYFPVKSMNWWQKTPGIIAFSLISTKVKTLRDVDIDKVSVYNFIWRGVVSTAEPVAQMGLNH
jgi:hypothetical protein